MGFMRKMTVRMKPTMVKLLGFDSIFKAVESFNIIEFVRIDYERLIEMLIIEFTLHPGCSVKDVKLPKHAKIVEIYSKQGQRIECLMESRYPKAVKPIFKWLNVDVIWDQPCSLNKDEAVVSCIGEEKNLKKFLRGCRMMAKVTSVSYKPASYKGYGEFGSLTSRQRKILSIAYKSGYYQYPRKIDATKLASVVGCSKPTIIEHLRKIENKLINIAVEKSEMKSSQP